MALCGGPYFSYPLTSRFLVGGKLLGGYIHYPLWRLSDMQVAARDGLCFGSGASLTFRTTERYALSFFLDYHLMPSHSSASKEWMNMLTLGSSFRVTF